MHARQSSHEIDDALFRRTSASRPPRPCGTPPADARALAPHARLARPMPTILVRAALPGRHRRRSVLRGSASTVSWHLDGTAYAGCSRMRVQCLAASPGLRVFGGQRDRSTHTDSAISTAHRPFFCGRLGSQRYVNRHRIASVMSREARLFYRRRRSSRRASS